MTGECTRCRSIGPIHRHHLTGVDGHGHYIHPELTVRFCIPCHDGAHAILRAQHLDGRKEATGKLILARIQGFLCWMQLISGPHTLDDELLAGITKALEAPLAELQGLASLLDG